MRSVFNEDHRHPLIKLKRRDLRKIIRTLHLDFDLEAPATEMVEYILKSGVPWETAFPDGVPDYDIYRPPTPEPRMKRLPGDLSDQQEENRRRYYETLDRSDAVQARANQEVDHHKMKFIEMKSYAKKLGLKVPRTTNKKQLLEMLDGHPLTRR